MQVLFAIQETPQALIGFTLFEVLFGRRSQVQIDVTKKACMELLSPFWSVMEYVQDMQKHIKWVAAIIKEHMLATQREQRQAYNHPAQLRELKQDHVLLLLPSDNCKFLACWQSP